MNTKDTVDCEGVESGLAELRESVAIGELEYCLENVAFMLECLGATEAVVRAVGQLAEEVRQSTFTPAWKANEPRTAALGSLMKAADIKDTESMVAMFDLLLSRVVPKDVEHLDGLGDDLADAHATLEALRERMRARALERSASIAKSHGELVLALEARGENVVDLKAWGRARGRISPPVADIHMDENGEWKPSGPLIDAVEALKEKADANPAFRAELLDHDKPTEPK